MEQELENIKELAKNMEQEERKAQAFLQGYDEKYFSMADKARTKLERFFMDIAETSPYPSVRLNIFQNTVKTVHLFKQNRPFAGMDDSERDFETQAVVLESQNGNWYVIPEKYAGCRFQQRALIAVSDVQMLRMVRDFDDIKKLTTKRLEEEIKSSTYKFQTDTKTKADSLALLKKFLNTPVAEQ